MRIETELFMTVEDFAQVVQVDQREQAGERLAAGDYEVVYQILTAAYRKERFPTWVGQETAPYWELLKQALVPWRATANDRARWRAALRAASEPVVVDPDLLYASDFLFNARAYSLFLTRTTEVNAHVTALRTQVATARATPPTAVERTALDALLTSELQVSAQDLLDLEAASDEGQDSEWRLDQLLLDPESLSELTRIIRLAATAAGTKRFLDREWDAVFSICTQVWKRRERALAWRDEERRRSATVRPITLGPDFFRILAPPHDVFPPPSLPALPRWRGECLRSHGLGRQAAVAHRPRGEHARRLAHIAQGRRGDRAAEDSRRPARRRPRRSARRRGCQGARTRILDRLPHGRVRHGDPCLTGDRDRAGAPRRSPHPAVAAHPAVRHRAHHRDGEQARATSSPRSTRT